MSIEIKNIFCKHCNTTKPETEFYFYRPKKCKICCCSVINNKPINKEIKKENNKKYYLKNKAKIIKHNIDYYHNKKAQYLAMRQAQTQAITPTL
jgi:hypothetical protein